MMAFSQASKSTVTYRVGVSGAAVVGDYKDFYNSAIGISFETLCKPYKKVGFTTTVGYTRFIGKDNVDGFGQIPVLGGVRYDLDKTWHVGVQGGVSFYDGGNTDINFTYVPYVEYSTKNVNVAAKYMSIQATNTAINTVGISVSYKL